ncbi:hypothetical protein [Nannocystis pusilla]|uniref:hypothetical protein n=1 Tax=Nannocystis pusilla TaxID=889268 RepID=UPI003DA51268
MVVVGVVGSVVVLVVVSVVSVVAVVSGEVVAPGSVAPVIGSDVEVLGGGEATRGDRGRVNHACIGRDSAVPSLGH